MTIPVVVLSNAKDLVLLLKGSQPGYFGQKHELRMTAFVFILRSAARKDPKVGSTRVKDQILCPKKPGLRMTSPP
jgi:hypothetical protein